MTVGPYPTQFESEVVLRTGHTLHLRPVRAEDRERLIAFYARLSAEALHARFFDTCTPDRAAAYSPAEVDYDREFGVIGESNEDIIAVAHYFASPRRNNVAEVAFAIADSGQGHGIGTKLLEVLIAAARTHGIDRFEADVLADNRRMLDVFLGMGFIVETDMEAGTVHLSFPIAPTLLTEQRAAERSQTAAAASMRTIFAPRSIAVVGASRRPGQLGNEIVRHLRSTGYRGSLYVVNPHAIDVESVAAFQSMIAIKDEIELAIIAVPAAFVESVLDDCIAKHVSAVVIISAGFGETGEKGRAIERRLLEKVRAAGVRMVGPNCMGVINTDPSVRMQATFADVYPPAGNVAMSSQSGALGLAVLDYARSLHIGFSTFISVGNKADVSGNDLIQYWADDPRTNVILLYLESFGNPRKFSEIARRVGRKKPIVAVKAGRSAGGARAASSHTGALASADAIVDDLFRQAGVIRTDTLEEMFDVAALLAKQPLPKGSRVAIATNAGGPGILAADACEANGLTLARLSRETTEKLRAILPSAASVGNPIDMIASATAEQYRAALQLLLADPGVDSVIAIYIPVLPTEATEVAKAIQGCASDANGKTLLATFMGAAGTPIPLDPVPAYPFPERAVQALAAATRYADWHRTPVGSVISFDDIDQPRLRSIVDATLEHGGGWLEPLDVAAVLAATGINAPAIAFARTADEAMEAAISIGFPVALKAYGQELLHKSEVGGVKLGLPNESSVYTAYEDLLSAIGNRMTGALVQAMASDGVEMMVGATVDPAFGHVIAAGAGGTLVELLNDVAFRLNPLTDADSEAMLSGLRCLKLLRGFRGSKPSDIAALRNVILRVSALLEICPEIRELDLNPTKVRESGAVVVDARIRVERPAVTQPSLRVAY
ncbi:MAG TPA: GNAT family N-acetyltransferase [Thermoanaerobaculia bacterium]|jgi:acetyl coenzyme A synthetase (ADP forming)-like protein|nr:GNAT family N-acetyltransferase [Thermoanaerobaculia bacterium]